LLELRRHREEQLRAAAVISLDGSEFKAARIRFRDLDEKHDAGHRGVLYRVLIRDKGKEIPRFRD